MFCFVIFEKNFSNSTYTTFNDNILSQSTCNTDVGVVEDRLFVFDDQIDKNI